MTEFDRDTAVEQIGSGRYAGRIGGDWSVPRGPNGGYVAAIVLRAMLERLGDPERAPRSLTLHYLRPPAEGDVWIEVVVERAGRSLSTLTARMHQDGAVMVLAIGAFATSFPSPLDYATAPPAVPPPEAAAVRPPHPQAPPIQRRIEVRPVIGQAIFSSADEALSGGWLRLAEQRVADAVAVAFYADAWMPAVYTRLPAPVPAPTVDMTIHFRARLPLAGAEPDDPVLGVFRSTTSRDGFWEEDGQIWSRDGVLLAQSRQLALLLG